jgi:hypothetical protein
MEKDMEIAGVAAAWVLGQAFSLVAVPIGRAARDAFAEQIGRRAGDWAVDRVRGWLRSPPTTLDEVAELDHVTRDAPQLGSILTEELGRRLGVHLAPAGEDRWVGSDAFVVDAYAAIHWRLAALAQTEGRPLAVTGALQGDGWITVCVPDGPLFGQPSALPDPADLWYRVEAGRARRPPWTPPARFLVSKTSGSEGDEARRLNRAFRLRGFDARLDEATGVAPASDTFMPLDGFSSLWVAIRPPLPLLIEMTRHTASGIRSDASEVRYDDYPADWQRFVDIPDEAAGIRALTLGIDEAAAASDSLRARIESIIDGDR